MTQESVAETRAGTGNSQLLIELNTRVTEAENAETAIALYGMTSWLIGQLDQVRRAALDLAEQDMKRREVESLKTPVGTAGWTSPERERLDQDAWRQALAQNPRLAELQRQFETAQAALLRAQEPYRESTLPEFEIR